MNTLGLRAMTHYGVPRLSRARPAPTLRVAVPHVATAATSHGLVRGANPAVYRVAIIRSLTHAD